MKTGTYKPRDYLIHLFNSYDVIFLGEDHGIKEHLMFVKELIPYLHQNGVTNLVMEFGASEDQDTLDQLISADTYDDNVARELLFRYNVIFPYKEYMDLYKAVWAFNHQLDDHTKPFRIVNMSYLFDWSHAKTADSVQNPDIIRQIFHKGSIEYYRANIIEKEIFDRGEKALVLTGTIHAYSHFKRPVFDYLYEDFIRPIDRHLGNLVHAKHSDQVVTVLFNQPYPLDEMKSIPGQTIQQLMEDLYLQEGSKSIAVDFTDSKYGEMIDKSYLSLGNNHLKLKEIAKGYIIIKPLTKLTGCSVDKAFLGTHTLSDITNQWPDPNWHKPVDNLTSYWSFVTDYVDLSKRYGYFTS